LRRGSEARFRRMPDPPDDAPCPAPPDLPDLDRPFRCSGSRGGRDGLERPDRRRAPPSRKRSAGAARMPVDPFAPYGVGLGRVTAARRDLFGRSPSITPEPPPSGRCAAFRFMKAGPPDHGPRASGKDMFGMSVNPVDDSRVVYGPMIGRWSNSYAPTPNMAGSISGKSDGSACHRGWRY